MRRTLGLTGTIAIHVAALLLVVPISYADPDKPLPQAQDYEKSPQLLPKQQLVHVSVIPIETDQPRHNGAADPRICNGKAKEYKGIGILHGIGSLSIESAPAEYPAYKAGARVGDFIHKLYQIPGTDYMILHVKRGGKFLKFRIKMEQICFKD